MARICISQTVQAAVADPALVRLRTNLLPLSGNS